MKKVLNDYCPTSPDYDSTYKQDPLAHCGPNKKQALNLNYYLPNYVSEEDTQFLVDNLVVLSVGNIKEEDQEEEEKGEKNNGEKTNREEEYRKMQTRHRQTHDKKQMKKRTIIQTAQTQISFIKK